MQSVRCLGEREWIRIWGRSEYITPNTIISSSSAITVALGFQLTTSSGTEFLLPILYMDSTHPLDVSVKVCGWNCKRRSIWGFLFYVLTAEKKKGKLFAHSICKYFKLSCVSRWEGALPFSRLRLCRRAETQSQTGLTFRLISKQLAQILKF